MAQESVLSHTKNDCLKFELKGKAGDQVSCLKVDKKLNPSRLVAGNENGQVRIYNLETQKTVKGLSLKDCVNSIQFSKECPGELLYVASGSTVSLFDLRAPELIIKTPTLELPMGSDEINQVFFIKKI
jgi:WD40 repeat protein